MRFVFRAEVCQAPARLGLYMSIRDARDCKSKPWQGLRRPGRFPSSVAVLQIASHVCEWLVFENAYVVEMSNLGRVQGVSYLPVSVAPIIYHWLGEQRRRAKSNFTAARAACAFALKFVFVAFHAECNPVLASLGWYISIPNS